MSKNFKNGILRLFQLLLIVYLVLPAANQQLGSGGIK